MNRGPFEWGWDYTTRTPKVRHIFHLNREKGVSLSVVSGGFVLTKLANLSQAPRSHYDHVSKKLVLNMDHYCPWMFNCVGYGNYRHFVLFMMCVLPCPRCCQPILCPRFCS